MTSDDISSSIVHCINIVITLKKLSSYDLEATVHMQMPVDASKETVPHTLKSLWENFTRNNKMVDKTRSWKFRG